MSSLNLMHVCIHNGVRYFVRSLLIKRVWMCDIKSLYYTTIVMGIAIVILKYL